MAKQHPPVEPHRCTFKRSELIKQADFPGSPITVNSYRKAGLLDCERSGHQYRYCDRSVHQLRLIPELRKYAFVNDEIKQVFDKIPFEALAKLVGSVPPGELYEFVESWGVELEEWY